MFRPVQIVSNRIEFLECHVDGAVLAARQKQSALSLFEILLNARPSRSANSETGARNMRRHLVFLQRMELLELFQTECKNVVIESAGRSAEQTVEHLIARRSLPPIPRRRSQLPRTWRLGFALHTKRAAGNVQIQPSSVIAAIQRFIPANGAAAVETKEHRRE